VVDQRFHRLVDARPWRRRDLAVLHAVVAGGHELHALAHDLDRLEDLVEADLVAVEDVAVRGVDHVEVDVVVGEVRLRLAEVPREAGGPQDGTGGVEGQRLLRGDHADADGALAPDRVLGQQGVVLGDAPFDLVAQLEHVVLPAVGKVGGQSAGADEVVVHPQPGDGLEQPKRLLALAPAVDHHRHRAEVHAVGGLEQEVRADAGDLDEHHAHPGRALGELEVEEAFHRHREHELVRQR